MTTGDKTIFVIRCLLTGSIGDSIYLFGVWFLGSVNVFESTVLTSLALMVSLPLTFALDRRVQILLGNLKSKRIGSLFVTNGNRNHAETIPKAKSNRFPKRVGRLALASMHFHS